MPPATVPGLGSGEETALSAAARPEAEVADADARLDAARERLRARIQPPAPDDDG